MAEPRSDRDASSPDRRPGAPAPSAPDHRHADLPRDHHPADARSPAEYTETPGSHRKGRHGPATDIGA
jgi:hypothetical protein